MKQECEKRELMAIINVDNSIIVIPVGGGSHQIYSSDSSLEALIKKHLIGRYSLLDGKFHKLNNLKTILKKGFVLTLGEINGNYYIEISVKRRKVYFYQYDKFYGMENVLKDAEDWAGAIVEATINSSL